MNFIDWLIVIVPVAFIVWIAFYSRKYVRGVVDYLAAGRLAGRYVLIVGDMTAGLGLITLVAYVAIHRFAGFTMGFYLIAMIIGTIDYVAGSLFTYRKPYNLNRLLHRDQYNTDKVEEVKSKWTLKTTF